jgi:hypothetical protein
MKKFVLAGCLAGLAGGLYVWGSKPARYVPKGNHQYVSSLSVTDTVPKRRDTLPHRDTLPRRDSLQ